jgi:hypothetical protein
VDGTHATPRAPAGLIWTVSGPGGRKSPWSESDLWLDRMFKVCADVGVEAVHAGLDDGAAARAPRLLDAVRRADRPPTTVILVREGSDPPRAAARRAGLESRPPDRPGRVLDVWPEGVTVVTEVRRSEGPWPSPADTEQLPAPIRSAWGIGYDEPPSGPAFEADLARRPGWVRFPFHLLSAPAIDEALATAQSASVPVLSSDPFADGRLDGSRLRGSPLDDPGRPAPADWAAVRRTWSPVLALGFLTEARQRTLPQAALQYVLGTAGVTGALVPASDSAAISEVALVRRLPGLTQGERERIAALRAGGPTVPPGALPGAQIDSRP